MNKTITYLKPITFQNNKSLNRTAVIAIMNSSEQSGSGGRNSSSKIGGFAYGIGVSVGFLVLITTITLASYYCTRNHRSASPTTTRRTRRRRRQADETPEPLDLHHDDLTAVEVSGLDEETITSYPKLPYEEARVSYVSRKNSSTTSCCSICLADYKSSDTIRVLPDCNHLFHDKCVDPWLRLHPTCPICRTSPLPTPVATPLVEVAPLAGQSRD